MNEEKNSSQEIVKILNFAKNKTFDSGEYIFKEGEENKNFYMLMEGEVVILKNTHEGHEKEIARIKAGEFIGEGIFSGVFIKPTSAKIIKDAKMLVFGKEDFDKMLEKDPQTSISFLISLFSIMHFRLNQSNIKLLTLFEINKLISLHHDDLDGLSEGIITKMIGITKSEDGIILVKNQFNNSYRTIYSTDKNWDEEFFNNMKSIEPKIITNNKRQIMIVPTENIGAIALSRSITDTPYSDADLRLFILVGQQTASAIESASRRASDKAKNILHQKRFTL